MRNADSYLEQMRAHVDEGGTLTHSNAVTLLSELEAARKQSKVLMTLCGSLVEICTALFQALGEGDDSPAMHRAVEVMEKARGALAAGDST
jgi:hypothetical protein